MKSRYNKREMPLMESALEFFFQHPSREVYLREYGRILKISPNSAQRFLDRFVAQGYLVEQRRGHLRYFKANLLSLTLRQLKITSSLKELESNGVLSMLQASGVSHVVLFGSVAEGKDDKESDIDLLVIASAKEEAQKAVLAIQKRLSREVNAHIFSWSEWKGQAKTNKAFYLDVITKGIALIGEKPVVT